MSGEGDRPGGGFPPPGSTDDDDGADVKSRFLDVIVDILSLCMPETGWVIKDTASSSPPSPSSSGHRPPNLVLADHSQLALLLAPHEQHAALP